MTFFSITKKQVLLSNQVNEDLFLESHRARILDWSSSKSHPTHRITANV